MVKKLKINGLMNDDMILWKKLKCKCDKSDIAKSFPLIDCNFCKFGKQEKSMPKDQFDVKWVDDKGKKHTKQITQLTIDRGEKYQEIRGWTYF
jgi:hypothetical protein